MAARARASGIRDARWLQLAGVLFSLAGCHVSPAASGIELCSETGPSYLADGTPSHCYAYGEMSRVAPSVAACSSRPGIAEVVFRFEREGAPRGVRASFDCQGCRVPERTDPAALLACIERVVSSIRLPLQGDKDEFLAAFRYELGVPEDPRLKLGWSPMDRGTH